MQKIKRIIIFFITTIIINGYLFSQTVDSTISKTKVLKNKYWGITAGYSYSYMESNFNWKTIYKNCNNCKVGYNRANVSNYIDIEYYEDKEYIKERNIPSYMNNGFNVGLNYLAPLRKKGNFFYEVSINYVDQGKFYYAPAIYTKVLRLYSYTVYYKPDDITYIPLIYHLAEIKTLDLNLKINYRLNILRNKLSVMPFFGFNRSQLLHSRISVYEFEGNKYVGKFNRRYYPQDKYESRFKNIIYDRAFQLNTGISLMLKLKSKNWIMASYKIIDNNIIIWETLMKNEKPWADYMLLHNKGVNNTRIKTINSFELTFLRNF
ncbi:MAG: hypothetical protein ACK4IK_09465 [Bacteroidia bacterium]|nr:MAG: hypothetical protein KatS3mg027_2559 [Bacteroidia bacterium]